jgi:predicted GIY-YIG superfamily endonuclease
MISTDASRSTRLASTAATRVLGGPPPWIYSQTCTTRYEALSAERQIKGWSRAKKRALIDGDWDEISRLAKSRTALRSFD